MMDRELGEMWGWVRCVRRVGNTCEMGGDHIRGRGAGRKALLRK